MKIKDYEKQGRTFIIAEIGQAHDGSVGILHSLVKAAAATGVDAIKFQVHIAEAESSLLEPFRVKFSYVDDTRFDYWRRMELSISQWKELKALCDKLDVEFLATPFSNAAVDLLEELNVKRYKIGSGDLNNPLLLEKIARTGKEVILSTGLGTLSELEEAIEVLSKNSCDYALLQCTTKYPTAAKDIDLSWLSKLKERYNCPTGLSDHSGKIYAGLAAMSLGASIVETHITFDRRMFGPDAIASLTIDELACLVEGSRFIEQARISKVEKSITPEKESLRKIFGKALAVNCSMKAGEEITFAVLEGKKPADAGIPINDFKKIIGKKLTCNKNAWDFLVQEDFE